MKNNIFLKELFAGRPEKYKNISEKSVTLHFNPS